MKKSVVAAVLLGALSVSAHAKDAAIPAPTSQPDWIGVRSEIEQYVIARMVDPESAQISWTHGFRWGSYKPPFGKRYWGWIGCATVNARNQLGGYAGPATAMFVWNNGIVFSDSDRNYVFPNIIKKCGELASPQIQPTLATKKPTPALASVADELAKLATLRDKGIITSQEFEAQKTKMLSR